MNEEMLVQVLDYGRAVGYQIIDSVSEGEYILIVKGYSPCGRLGTIFAANVNEQEKNNLVKILGSYDRNIVFKQRAGNEGAGLHSVQVQTNP